MSLTEEDDERENDKKGKCYICSKEKSDVMIWVYRYKKRVRLSRSTLRSTSSGITCTTYTVWRAKTKLTTRVLSISYSIKFKRRM
jgi:hypothetical protein